MRVFISWSGPQSRIVATRLGDWLPRLFNSVTPFVSESIESGARWSQQIADALDECSVGIICVTQANQSAPWLNFEAGAIAKRVGDETRVIPLAIDLTPAQINQPLGQFQAVSADEQGVRRIIATLASSLKPDEPSLAPEQLEDQFEMLWPRLEDAITEAQVPVADSPAPPSFDEEAVLSEILLTIRRLDQRTDDTANHAFPTRLQVNDAVRTKLYARLRDAAATAGVVVLGTSESGGTIHVDIASETSAEEYQMLQRLLSRASADLGLATGAVSIHMDY